MTSGVAFLLAVLLAGPQDHVLVPRSKLLAAVEAGDVAVGKGDWFAVLDALEFPAKCGHKRSQFLYGVAIASLGDLAGVDDPVMESLAWLYLSQELGRMDWTHLIRDMERQADREVRKAAKDYSKTLIERYGYRRNNMFCNTGAPRGSGIKTWKCEWMQTDPSWSAKIPWETVAEFGPVEEVVK